MKTTPETFSMLPVPSDLIPSINLRRWSLVMVVTLFCLLAVSIVEGQSAAGGMLKYGQPVNGTLAAGAQVEYTFEGKQGDKPVITMNMHGGNLVPCVALYDPQGNLIGEDCHTGPKGNALLKGIVLAADGIYKVIAVNQAQDGSGGYSLLVSEEQHQIFYDGTPLTGSPGTQAYQLSQPWDHTNITFSIYNTLNGFSQQEVHDVLVQALQAWGNNSPLTFTETQGQADINIEFGSIDGSYNILGETCPPYDPCGSGSVVLDSDESWTLYEPQSYDEISLLGVATHEFGHALGLLHTDDTNALMYPEYSPYVLQPDTDDIAGLQRLYGARTGPVANPTSLPGNPTTTDNGQMQVSGEINDQEYAHFWDFDVVAGDTVTISMSSTSGDLDSFLVLLDANNNVIAYDDDAAGDRNARLANLSFPESGTYTVAATRYAQAQGYTAGTYALGIQYDVGTAGSIPVNPPTSGSGGGGSFGGSGNNGGTGSAGNSGNVGGSSGSVLVSSAQNQQTDQMASLDEVLNNPFANSTVPVKQVREGSVYQEQAYLWQQAWCALDDQTLADNLNDLSFTFAVNGEPIDPATVTQQKITQEQYHCAVFLLILSDWEGSALTLTVTMHMDAAVFDGQTIYPAGDYIYEYDLQIK